MKLDESAGEIEIRYPQLLPDQNHYLYASRLKSQPQLWQIYLGSLKTSQKRKLISAESKAIYLPPGYLVFMRSVNLVAVSFDLVNMQVGTNERPISTQVSHESGAAQASVSASGTGMLAYGSINRNTQLVWFDRRGGRLADVGPAAEYGSPALSPDEKRLLVDAWDPGAANQRDLWMLDFDRGSRTRLTVNPEDDSDPVWSPDGSKVLYHAIQGGKSGLNLLSSNGGGELQRLLEITTGRLYPRDWSSDERYMVYQAFVDGRGSRLWILPTFGEKQAFRFNNTEFNEADGRFSPNVKWLAYDSNESETRQVYVQPFPARDAKWQISTNGGSDPHWRRDGKELFYLAEDGKLMAVAISESPFKAGLSQPLFQTNLKSFGGAGGLEHYVVSADGQRFLLNVEPPDEAAHITVIANWASSSQK